MIRGAGGGGEVGLDAGTRKKENSESYVLPQNASSDRSQRMAQVILTTVAKRSRLACTKTAVEKAKKE